MNTFHIKLFYDLDEKEQEYIQSAFDEYKELVDILPNLFPI